MSEEYNLTFLEAMKALCEGKDVKNEVYDGIFYNPEGAPLYKFKGKAKTAWFTETDVTVKWRVVE